MLGDGTRRRGILPTESIPRDSLRDVRRQLECTRCAKALSARLLAKSHAPQRAHDRDDRPSLRNGRLDPDQAPGDASATQLKRLRNRLRILAEASRCSWSADVERASAGDTDCDVAISRS